jgi:predicted GNAT family acetyltransferase
MSWRPAAKNDSAHVLEFLLRDEAFHVPFTSRLRSSSRGYEVFLDADERGKVTDCLMVTSGGLLLPALSPEASRRGDLAEFLRRLRRPIRSLMGFGRSVGEVEALLPIAPTTRVEYFLMSARRGKLKSAVPPLDPEVRIRRAGAADAEELFPLQRGYELEEVVIDPVQFNDGQCMKLLKRSLKVDLVYVAERGGDPVSKAATNARGFGVDQVGGVYTEPAERGKGYAKAVVVALLKAIFKEKSAACLFVKKRNRPAVSLYDRLGFEPNGDYVISYYGI